MRVLIADDEAPARGELRFMLETLEPTATLLEVKNGNEATAVAEQEALDVAFLDINMPGLSGLGVAARLLRLPEPPVIVFATAYDEHAVKAFELSALDYLVKPFDEARLAQTLKRVRQSLADANLREKRQREVQSYLQADAAQANQVTVLTKLWLERANENRVLVDYGDIYWLEAQDKKVFAHTFDGKLLARYTLKELEDVLGGDFVRVHKATLVNLNHVGEVVPWFSGGYLLRMTDAEKSELGMSRRYAAKLKELTGWR